MFLVITCLVIEIPKNMVQISRVLNLNLLFNNLKGVVPSSCVFKNSSEDQVLGNLNLCGGIQGLYLHPCFVHSEPKHMKHIYPKLVVVLANVVLCLAFLWFLLLWR